MEQQYERHERETGLTNYGGKNEVSFLKAWETREQNAKKYFLIFLSVMYKIVQIKKLNRVSVECVTITKISKATFKS